MNRLVHEIFKFIAFLFVSCAVKSQKLPKTADLKKLIKSTILKVSLFFDAYVMYTLCHKNVPLCHLLYLRQILTDFQNSFTGAYCRQLAIK